jgi:hypothetical protein
VDLEWQTENIQHMAVRVMLSFSQLLVGSCLCLLGTAQDSSENTLAL